ncbi:hypothetical protein D3C78_1680000 [compost metagenome]
MNVELLAPGCSSRLDIRLDFVRMRESPPFGLRRCGKRPIDTVWFHFIKHQAVELLIGDLLASRRFDYYLDRYVRFAVVVHLIAVSASFNGEST